MQLGVAPTLTVIQFGQAWYVVCVFCVCTLWVCGLLPSQVEEPDPVSMERKFETQKSGNDSFLISAVTRSLFPQRNSILKNGAN